MKEEEGRSRNKWLEKQFGGKIRSFNDHLKRKVEETFGILKYAF